MEQISPRFSLPHQSFTFKGLLFDMDGTIIDSTSAVEKHWHSIGAELNVDPKVILQTPHGRRSIDVLRAISPEKATWECKRVAPFLNTLISDVPMEEVSYPYPFVRTSVYAVSFPDKEQGVLSREHWADKVTDIKHMEGLLPFNYGSDAVEIAGARAVLNAVTEKNVPWAVVTSGTTPLVTGWLKVLKLPLPDNLVVAEDVEIGKPDPACYLMGMSKLGLKAGDEVLVVEDSPAGINAGKAAGCKVLGLVTSHTVEEIANAAPDWIVQDLRSFKIIRYSDEGVEIEITNALVFA